MARVSSKDVTGHVGRYVDTEICDPAGQTQRVQVHIGESPLSWLYARGLLSERLFIAGEALRQDWERAGLGARVTMAWDAAPRSGGPRSAPGASDPHSGQISARQRLDAALACAGPGLSDVLWRVVCAGEGLTAAERALGWPSRAAKLVLGFALERVANYYRVPAG
ncbi:MAG TPA: DUF6456 domain-containing protein [Sphingobium sp.]|nr:DUF6456 domain-containing protein [Sphingobium sp.]